jgi:hypothetical protein
VLNGIGSGKVGRFVSKGSRMRLTPPLGAGISVGYAGTHALGFETDGPAAAD